MGPSLIFDKSALQGLSDDESMWLENFYLNNITPLFFVETLADLEKEVRKGRLPEDVVGSIARKTPDMSCVAVHHQSLIAGELLGYEKVEMSGRPIISGGKTVELEGKTGVIFQDSPEMEASKRWGNRQFLDIERNIAKNWRKEIAASKIEDYSGFEKIFTVIGRPRSFQELKGHVDYIAKEMADESAIDSAMGSLGVIREARMKVLERWKLSGSKPISEFAPYFSYIFSVDLFFSMGTAANLFESFAHPQTHKIDISYLYYLPFCNIFTSSDKLHINIAPLFMREDQTFVRGEDLKNDFSRLNDHYDHLPEEIKSRGVVSFAPCPPDDTAFLTTRLWDKYMSQTWREMKSYTRKFDGTDKINPETEKTLKENIEKFMKEARPTSSRTHSDEAEHMVLRHMVSGRKGKWRKFPPEVLNSKPILDQ